jgi:hypothetical protein
MTFIRIRQYIVYLLVALLSLQAAAAGRMAVCAELGKAAPEIAVMKHCDHMKDMASPKAADDSAAHSHKADNCWIGSICLAGMPAFAMPMQQVSASVQQGFLPYFTSPTHYHSIVPDHPQRPPSAL